MRRVILWVATTATVLTLLLSYRTSLSSGSGTSVAGGARDTSGTGDTPSDAASGTGSSSSGSSDAGSRPGTASGSGTSSASDGIYTGAAVSTRWGPVQVQITVSGGQITKAKAVEYPSGNPKDHQINAYAIPKLNAEAEAAQSAGIDTVSGATVTSNGYIDSLQSAIDKAHL